MVSALRGSGAGLALLLALACCATHTSADVYGYSDSLFLRLSIGDDYALDTMFPIYYRTEGTDFYMLMKMKSQYRLAWVVFKYDVANFERVENFIDGQFLKQDYLGRSELISNSTSVGYILGPEGEGLFPDSITAETGISVAFSGAPAGYTEMTIAGVGDQIGDLNSEYFNSNFT
eukprot:CAMPEP_0170145114 /NCGR_PEP_ID=MMETSP0033_2-20121228/16344_1 /TAXON_ID=195969 /ORGANISM="Dolichomastix tenuilepis, Strain CCMP3274" /LENGTH=174 /DNA_ID=CAMNT_0010381649 /DNA_START=186 /DNA_END=706 /DNA_ORIENTATION=+